MFQNITPDLQDKIENKTTMYKTTTKTDFWSQTGLVLRPTVSDHITGHHGNTAAWSIDFDSQVVRT